MNSELKAIIPGEGLGNIKFGHTRNDVQSIIGDPDEIEIFEEEGMEGEAWHYDELELSLSFDKLEDWRLVTFAVSSEYYQLGGKTLVGKQRLEVINSLSELGYGPLESDANVGQNGTESKLLMANSIETNFWFENDFLSEIQWGPFFKDDETIDWPVNN